MAIKIILLIFVLFVLLRTVFRFVKKEIRGRELVMWLVFWLAVSAAVILPQGADLLAKKVGVGRGVDLLLYVSVLVLFYLVFRVFVRLEKTDRQLTQIVRQTAIKNVDEGQEKE